MPATTTTTIRIPEGFPAGIYAPDGPAGHKLDIRRIALGTPWARYTIRPYGTPSAVGTCQPGQPYQPIPHPARYSWVAEVLARVLADPASARLRTETVRAGTTEQAMPRTCQRCHRPIWADASVQAGHGKTCQQRQQGIGHAHV